MLKSAGTIDVRTSSKETVVFLLGEIDHHNAAFLRMRIDKLIHETHPKRLVLDLSSIRFMDSSGLGFIMGRLTLVREMGGDLVVRNPSEGIMRILRLAGMEKIVKIEKGGKQGEEKQ